MCTWRMNALVCALCALLLPPAAAQTTVVLDTSHGYAAGGGISYFPQVISLLEAWGHTVVENTDELTTADLSGAGLLITNVGWMTQTPFGTAERDAIVAFVAAGGSFFVMSDHPAMNNAYLNPVTQQFGISCGVAWMYDYVALASPHPVMSGLGDFEMSIGGTLTVSGTAEVVALNGTGQTVIAANPEDGKVVVAGDVCLSNTGWEPPCEQFLANVVSWFGLNAVSVESRTWAGVKALYR